MYYWTQTRGIWVPITHGQFCLPSVISQLRLWWCECVNHVYSSHRSKFTVWQSICSIHVILLFECSANTLWRSDVSGCRYVLGMSVRFANLCHCAIMLKMDWVNGGSYMILPAVSDRLPHSSFFASEWYSFQPCEFQISLWGTGVSFLFIDLTCEMEAQM